MNNKHLVLMLACCLVPVAGLAAIILLNVPAYSVVLVGLALFCPLAHFLMLKFMPREHGAHEAGTHTKAAAPLFTDQR